MSIDFTRSACPGLLLSACSRALTMACDNFVSYVAELYEGTQQLWIELIFMRVLCPQLTCEPKLSNLLL